jgi:hypothetical protein
MKKILFIFLTISLLSLNTNAQNPTSKGILNESKMTNNVFAEFSMLEVEFYKNGEGELRSKNISTYIMGLTSTLSLSKNFDLRGSVGMTEGFSYNFATCRFSIKIIRKLFFALRYRILFH